MSTATYIPSDSDVATPTNSRSVWRVANGEICTGREEDGTLKTREKIVGLLHRIGVHEGHSKQNGTYFKQLEADIETAEGVVRLKASVSDIGGAMKPGVAAITFAEGLLELAKDELFIARAAQGTKKNKYGNYTSYTNLFHYNHETKQSAPAKRTGAFDATETMLDRWEALEAELKAHPAYADRPASERDEDGVPASHLSALVGECQERGWPHPEQCPPQWLGMMAKAFKTEARGKLTDYSDDQWGAIRLKFKELTEMPGFLRSALGPVVPVPDDFDPFAD